MRVVADEVPLRGADIQVAVGEVAAPTARNTDFLRHFLAVVQHEHIQPALRGDSSTEQASCTGANDDGIEMLHGRQCMRGCRIEGVG